MNSKDLTAKLNIVLKIVARCETSKITNIERDIVLAKLQEIYEAILSSNIEINTHTEESEIIETHRSETNIITEIVIEEEEQVVEIEEEQVVEIVKEEEIVKVTEPVVDSQEIPDEPTDITPKETAIAVGIRPMISRQVIRSLYDDQTPYMDKTEKNNDSAEAIEATIIEEQTEVANIIIEAEQPTPTIEYKKAPTVEYKAPTTIGDTISTKEYTLADRIGETIKSNDIANAVAKNSSTTLSGSIGVNDKFLMLNEIFEGDINKYNTTIETLEQFADLDEALIFIHDNYKWNPSNSGVQLLIELLGRKLS